MLHMQDYEYLPARMEAAAGATVLVMNFGQEPHTVTAVERSLFDVQDIRPGGEPKSFRAPATPGEYPFYCVYHATPETTPEEGMAGVLVVTEATTQATTPASPSPTTPAQEKKDAPIPGAAIVLAVGALGALALGRRRA